MDATATLPTRYCVDINCALVTLNDSDTCVCGSLLYPSKFNSLDVFNAKTNLQNKPINAATIMTYNQTIHSINMKSKCQTMWTGIIIVKIHLTT